MSRDEVLMKLRQNAPDLQACGILHLELFGSTARNESTDESDVDLMAEYDPSRKISLLGVCRLENILSDVLGARVDLCSRTTLRPFALETAEKDAVHVF